MMKPTKKDYTMMERAIQMSHTSPMLMRIGCVIANGKKVAASGCNHYRTQYSDGITCETCSCHAEMDALRRLLHSTYKKDLKVSLVGQRTLKVANH